MNNTKFTKDMLDSLLYSLESVKTPSYKISVSPYHPKNKPVLGTFTSRAHPFIEWLSRFIPFDPDTYFEDVVIGYTWADPIMIDDSALSVGLFGESKSPGKSYTIICSQEQADQLKIEAKRQKEEKYYPYNNNTFGGIY